MLVTWGWTMLDTLVEPAMPHPSGVFPHLLSFPGEGRV